MLNITITIDDGIKKSELKITETNEKSKLLLIHQVFSLFGANQDLLEMISVYEKIGAAYSSFFNETNPIEISPKQPSVDIDNIKEKMENDFKENIEELKDTYTNKDNEYYITGVKIENGIKRYRLYYICDSCNHKGAHYIYQHSPITWCHNCNQEMKVYTATPTPLERDTKGNFFRAGKYKDINIEWES